MAITFIEAQSVVGSAGSPYTTPAFTNAVAVGDCIVVGITSYTSGGGVAATSISDSAGNTWPGTPTASIADSAGSDQNRFTDIWVMQNSAAKGAGTYTVTVTYAGTPIIVNFGAGVFRGVATSSAVDTSGTANSGSTVTALSSTTSGSITNAGDLLVSTVFAGNGANPAGQTLPSNYGTWADLMINDNDASSVSGRCSYIILSGASLATKTANWTWTGGTTENCASAIVALIPAAGASGISTAWWKA